MYVKKEPFKFGCDFGYTLVGVLILSAVSSILLISASAYLIELYRIENKFSSDLSREILIQEVREVLRSTENCDENMQAKKIEVNQNKEQIAVMELNEIIRKIGTRSEPIITKASVYDNKWEVKSLTLDNFQGDQVGSASLFGIIQAVVSLVPVTSNYYYDNILSLSNTPQKEFKSYIPLSVTWLQDPDDNMTYKFRACNRSVRADDVANEHFCHLLSGDMDGGECKNVKLNTLEANEIAASGRITVTGDINNLEDLFIRGGSTGLYKIDNIEFSTKNSIGGQIIPYLNLSSNAYIEVSSIKPLDVGRWEKFPKKICVRDDIKVGNSTKVSIIKKADSQKIDLTEKWECPNNGDVIIVFDPVNWVGSCSPL